jgi:hypothetical protein
VRCHSNDEEREQMSRILNFRLPDVVGGLTNDSVTKCNYLFPQAASDS